MANLNIKSKVDYNKIAGANYVLPDQTRASITTPVDGQITFESGVAYVYNNTKTAWEPLGAGAIRIKGTVGTDASHPEWLSNLPDEPNNGDAYMVGSAGSYGPTGATQHADVGDMFVCVTEKTTTVAAKWTLVPSGNGRFAGTVTGDGTNTNYTINHPLNTNELVVDVFDASGNKVLVATQVTTNIVVLSFGYVVPNTETYTVVVIAG